METIGIVGTGFVGTALLEGMRHAFRIETYDNVKPSTCRDMTELVELCPVIFVCVPTPMKPSGQSSTAIVEEVCGELAGIVSNCSNGDGSPIRDHLTVVIKSTVPPGTTNRLQEQLGHGPALGPLAAPGWRQCIDFVFNPEFLTEANFIDDFKNQDRIILGGENQGMQRVSELYSIAYPDVQQEFLHSTEAEMVKYITNIFLATKVALANELYQVCERLGISFRNACEAAQLDRRLGTSHWNVPGPDGSFGFGLSCFPKDLNALMHMAREHGINPRIMQAVWDKNLEVRPEMDRDWERMTKAVTVVRE